MVKQNGFLGASLGLEPIRSENGAKVQAASASGTVMNLKKMLFAATLLLVCSLCASGQTPPNAKSQIYYAWQNGAWVQKSKIEFVYDDKGAQTLQIEYHWQNNAWVEYAKNEYTYDAMGNLISHKSYIWQNGAWTANGKYEYTYDIKCYKKDAFGLDFGVGYAFGMERYTRFSNVYGIRDYHSLDLSLGFRYMHNFNHYLGADFVKVNWELATNSGSSVQIMTGVRGNTPAFNKCMSVYGALRVGYGHTFTRYNVNGICFETELGINLTRTVFMGAAYNFHSFDCRRQSAELRIGFNFGK